MSDSYFYFTYGSLTTRRYRAICYLSGAKLYKIIEPAKRFIEKVSKRLVYTILIINILTYLCVNIIVRISMLGKALKQRVAGRFGAYPWLWLGLIYYLCGNIKNYL